MERSSTLPYDVILKTDFGINIHLEFLDNPFVRKVFEKFKKLVETSTNIYANRFNYPFGAPKWNEVDIKILQFSLVEVINQINSKVTTPIPLEPSAIILEEGSQVTRKHLNLLHRYFTTYIESGFKTWSYDNDYNDKEIVLDGHKDEVYKLVGYINKIVHKLDKYFYSPEVNSRIKGKPLLDEFLIHFDNEVFTPFEDGDRDYRVSKGDYQIWLPLDCMKGKNYFDCYFDFDNPNEFDIENENIYTGAIALGDRNGFNDPDLNSWLSDNKVAKSIGIPLGYVTFGDTTIQHLTADSLIGIEIVEL